MAKTTDIQAIEEELNSWLRTTKSKWIEKRAKALLLVKKGKRKYTQELHTTLLNWCFKMKPDMDWWLVWKEWLQEG